LVGLPSISIYISPKFALEGFAESLSYELVSQNIVVKLVEPGGGDTAFRARASKLNTGAGGLDSYDPFLERANAALGKLGKRMAMPERVAAVIYGAVTDGTKRLRYSPATT
jgi:NAD(P)-dependent dehydrogenase (short-subunit alcohol dehydrogenase family)